MQAGYLPWSLLLLFIKTESLSWVQSSLRGLIELVSLFPGSPVLPYKCWKYRWATISTHCVYGARDGHPELYHPSVSTEQLGFEKHVRLSSNLWCIHMHKYVHACMTVQFLGPRTWYRMSQLWYSINMVVIQ